MKPLRALAQQLAPPPDDSPFFQFIQLFKSHSQYAPWCAFHTSILRIARYHANAQPPQIIVFEDTYTPTSIEDFFFHFQPHAIQTFNPLISDMLT